VAPQAWSGRPQWRLLRTGPGAAADFLAAWQAWRDDDQRPGLLHFVAIACADDLLPTVDGDSALAQQLAGQWQGLVPGFHRMAFDEGRVLLTLCVGELAAMLREQAFHADAIVLGPGADPQARSLHTLKAVTRLARRGTTLASSDATGEMGEQLRACGWQLAPATAQQPHGLTGVYQPAWNVPGHADAVRVAGEAIVIGAGLAGAAVACSLARRGWSVRVLDAAPAPAAGASSLPAGLLAPHQSPDDNLLSRLSRAGVRTTLAEARQRLAHGLEWGHTGVLERRGDDPRPPPALGEALGPWTRLAADAQKQAAGLDVRQFAWWHDNAGWIEPAALVRSWLRQAGVRFLGNCQVTAVRPEGTSWRVQPSAGAEPLTADLVVVAAALGSASLLEARVQVHAVRGQLTWAARRSEAGTLPPFPVNGEGHFLPDVPLLERGAWLTGSTYGRADADASVRGEDTSANLQRARTLLPAAAGSLDAAAAHGELRAWAGVRCAASDRRPLVGELAPGLWVSTAMGSRGLTFAALCAELLAARLHAEPLPLELRLARALDPGRQKPG
jgi:tRNA 5-methylaminomethyl-2-thiouridine biosynthesis bifunctional protein